MEGGFVDFSALERELRAAVEEESRYQRENRAKFRAVRQGVGTYREFRDIVLASHLKPLDKEDKGGAPRKQPWNSVAAGRRESPKHTPETEQPLLSGFQPRTGAEFVRDWRRFGGGALERYGLLLRLGGEVLQDIFRAEVGFGLLGEFLTVLSECLQPGDGAAVTGLLEGLSKTGRFDLNVSLLSRAEREACKHLFHKLQETVGVHHPPSQTLLNSDGQNKHACLSEEPEDPEAQHYEAEVLEKLKCLMAKYAIHETES